MPKVTKKKASPLLDEDTVEKSTPTPEESSEAQAEEVSEEKATPKVAPKAKVDVQAEMRSDIEVTRLALAKEEQVHFMIPLALGEKAGAFEDVWINGFHTRVPKGRMSILPKSIADLLSNKYAVEAEAGEEFRLDLDPNKSEALG